MVNTSAPPVTPKVSKLEDVKERSNFLREPVASELLLDTTHFSEDATQILKFHGSYQQDNRDNRVKGQEKDYQFMLRTRSPGGFIPPELYLTLDRLSDEYGNHTLRVTTRQGFQLHGILKQNLKATIAAIVQNMGSTLGACGDLNRNVMAPPVPYQNRPEYVYARDYANHVADLFTPQTGAYYEIWLDGEKFISAEENPEVVAARQGNGNGSLVTDSPEPIYGSHYLPRKFKCAVTVPGDNSVDLFSQDVSLVVITDANGDLQGFNIYAGGGLGRTHNKEETFPRLADPIGYVDQADVYEALKAIIATQRDYGDRGNRRHARMKYLLEAWGVDKFRTQVESYFGKPFQPLKPTPDFKYLNFLGWDEQGDGKLFVGISIDNGRIKDEGAFMLKTALREIVETYKVPMRLTPSQNVLLYDIEPTYQVAIQQILDRCGIPSPDRLDSIVREAMACPALPTCGLAITESERVSPTVLGRIRGLLDRLELPNEHFIVRMTGCPNGCARPYLAELAFVGNGPGTYQVWLGASPDQTRLAKVYLEKMHLDDLEAKLEPVFAYFKQAREVGERLGDFCDRVGLPTIQAFATTYEPIEPTATDEATEEPMATTATDEESTATATEEPMATTATDEESTATSTEEEGQEATTAPSEDSSEPRISKAGNKIRHRVTVLPETYDRLKDMATKQGKPVSHIASEAIETYLKTLD